MAKLDKFGLLDVRRYIRRMLHEWLAPYSFRQSESWGSEYLYCFEGGHYVFFLHNKESADSKQELVFCLSLSINYVIEKYKEVMAHGVHNKYENVSAVCTHPLRQDPSKRYVYVRSVEEATQTIEDILSRLASFGFSFLRRFTDVREIDLAENIQGNVLTDDSIIGGDVLYRYVLALVIAKLCRPGSDLTALVQTYREALQKEASATFYLDDYEPAVAYLLAADLGMMPSIEIPNLV